MNYNTICKHGVDGFEFHCSECCADEIRNLEMELDSLKNPVYCDGNVKSWEDMNLEVDKYYQLKTKLKEYLALASCDGRPIRKQLRKELQELIDE